MQQSDFQILNLQLW